MRGWFEDVGAHRLVRYIDGSLSTESIGINGPGSMSTSVGPSPKT
jgi:hypothetical protein